MDFNDKSVVFFKPQKMPVNILVTQNYAPLMAYFSIENIPMLKSYFKVIVKNSDITTFLHTLTKYGEFNSNDFDVLESFISYSKINNKDIIISIPIINYKKEHKDSYSVCFGNFISVVNDDYNKIEKSDFYPASISSIIINGKELVSPCGICRLQKDKIEDICIYRTSAYECLFNCDVQETKQKELLLEKEFITEDIKTLGEFLNSSEGETYK